MTNGILVVNKPTGYTSRDIVNIASKKLNTKKVGHTGTLDPLASGVLILCIGRYTKLVEMLTSLDKEYIAEIKLGIKTDTLDITGTVLENKSFYLTKKSIETCLNSFIGKYDMEVPIYSAIKVNGKKLYEYARVNEQVKLPVKTVNIYNLELLDFCDDIIKFKAHVEKGTYIRSLIRDICTNLNVCGTMNNLIRTKQGKFKLEDTCNLEDINKGNIKLLKASAVLDIPHYELSNLEYQKVKNGCSLNLNLKDKYIFFLYNNEEIAIYEKVDSIYKCYIMLDI